MSRIVFPDRPVPLGRRPLEPLGAPDVVDEDVEPAVRLSNAIREAFDLRRIEMIGDDRNAGSAKLRDQFRGVFDGLRPVVFGAGRS